MARVLPGFVALEGLDGAGTTTQLRLLTEALGERGRHCHPTCEPTGGPLGRELRRALRRETSVHPRTMALLFAADRNEHVYDPRDGILQHLERGEIVVTDRYLFSSLAYQSEACGFDYVLGLNLDFPLPEHLVFVDTPLGLCQERVRARGDAELYDAAHVQRTVLAYYERALALFPGSAMRRHRVDGSLTPEGICREICEALGA